jgi:ubiquinone/menaquinone biosynthesis C-methylase UbiE
MNVQLEDRILTAYTEQAGAYDQRTAPYAGWRRRIVDALPLARGDTVLDVGCGTGLCVPMLAERVGPTGAVVGVDESAQMLELARRRTNDDGLRNVVFVESRVEQADLPVRADAAIFCAAHDVLRSQAALERVFSRLRPGGWVVAGGGKWAPPWMVGLNLWVFTTHQPYVRDFTGFDRPWSLLAGYVDDLSVLDLVCGYVAVGRARAVPTNRSAS